MIVQLQIEWWHNGRLVTKNKTLTIERVNALDGGGYVCVARNEYGAINRTIDLIVLSKDLVYIFSSNCLHAVRAYDRIMLCPHFFILLS